ncbi:kelch repeat-containing protein [Nocardioides sp. SYSU DS0663]|uniref:Kelch repeat-containing protein n=1 Tax=Nocardioides sp. SYSU DS0663 TaxID=3416445 RepID=UPI003F4C4AB8
MPITWANVAPLPAARAALGAATDMQGRVYAIGGEIGSTTYGTLYRFDPATGQWSTLASMPTARRKFAAAADAQGRIYAIGGLTGNVLTTKVERFDPSTGQWTTLASLPTVREGLAATADAEGRIYAIGGRAGSNYYGTVERFDPSTGQWTTLPSISTRTALAAATDGQGRIYAISGTNSIAATNRVQRFDPDTGVWSDLPGVPNARARLTAASDTAGRVYAIGAGWTEQFDPATGVWSVLATAPAAPDAAAARGGDGALYFIGGISLTSGSAIADVQRADPNTAPNAPILTTLAGGEVVDRAVTNRAAHTFSDPDTGDSQSAFDLRYRIRDVGATWTNVYVGNPKQFYDFPAGSLVAGEYERQVRTYDSLGAVGPWSPSGFFTVADKPGSPAITEPINGAYVDQAATVTWSTPNQSAYQLRRVADAAGTPDPNTVHWDSGQINDASTRTRRVEFPTNGRPEHLQVRIKHSGLWSNWGSARVLVSFDIPPVPSLALTPDPTRGALLVTINNPTPTVDEEPTSYNDVYVDDGLGAGEKRKATGVPANSSWLYRQAVSGRDYTHAIRVVAVAANGTTVGSDWTPPPPVVVANPLDEVVYNQYGAPLRTDGRFPTWGKHEAALGGVNQTYDWYHGARPGPVPYDTTNPGFEGVDYRYHNIWGQVVPDGAGAGERRVRVHVDLPKVYHLAAGASAWQQVRGTVADIKNFEGGYWAGATFSKTTTMVEGTHWRVEADGGHSFDVALMANADGSPSAESIAHWYYSGLWPRLLFPQGGAIAICARMRLIPNAPGVDASQAKLLGAFSGDLYTGAETNTGANGRNPPLAITRHRRLTTSWQRFTYVSGTEAQIRAYPPLPFLTI